MVLMSLRFTIYFDLHGKYEMHSGISTITVNNVYRFAAGVYINKGAHREFSNSAEILSFAFSSSLHRVIVALENLLMTLLMCNQS